MLEILNHWMAVVDHWRYQVDSTSVMMVAGICLGMAMMLIIGIAVGRAWPAA